MLEPNSTEFYSSTFHFMETSDTFFPDMMHIANAGGVDILCFRKGRRLNSF